jgi:hypothetical protein
MHCNPGLPVVYARVAGPDVGVDAAVSDQRLTLTEGLYAPAHARAWASSRLPEVAQEVEEDLLLLVSELVTNAVRHGRPEIEVGISVSSERVRVEVSDCSDALPVLPPARPSVDRPTGRGLLIVSATALDWGVQLRPGIAGKTVWAELALRGPFPFPSSSPKFS